MKKRQPTIPMSLSPNGNFPIPRKNKKKITLQFHINFLEYSVAEKKKHTHTVNTGTIWGIA